MTSGNKKLLTAASGLLLGLALVVFLRGATSAADVLNAFTPASAEDAVADVYPLYNDSVVWGDKVRLSVPPHTSTNPTDQTIAGYVIASEPTATTTNVSSITEPYRNFYDSKLLKSGWKIDPIYQADGPGASIWGFKRGTEVIIFSFAPTFINHPAGRPLQCPCTISFYILAGIAK